MLKILPLNEETLDLEIDLCVKFHPSGFFPDEELAEEGRKLKKILMKRIFEKVTPAGFIAIDEGKPVALLELMPREYARRNGYITGLEGVDEETLTILCLEVARDQDRKRVMESMVRYLINNLSVFRPFKRIEVGAFPGDVDFHPSWVYENVGFKVAEDRDTVKVLSISIL